MGVGRVKRELSRLTVEPAEEQGGRQRSTHKECASQPGRGVKGGRKKWKLTNATKQRCVIQAVSGKL